MSKMNRRRFIQGTAGAIAASTLVGRAARAQQDVNSQIRIAVIGVNSRGGSHLSGFGDRVVAICDCDSAVLNRVADRFDSRRENKVDRVADFRTLMDRNDIDAIGIATPNHLHAHIGILAAQAGKDVYCEKPVSHNVWEGRQLVNAARRYDRIMQCGTQTRSNPEMKAAVDWVQGGGLGAIQYAVGTCYKPRKSIGKSDSPLAIPASVDYDLWCGPAAKVDLYRPQLHYDWHWDFNTGNGDMGNQGIHQMDIARWFLGHDTLSPRVISIGGRLGYDDAGNTPNTQVVLHDYPERPLIFETRGLPRDKASQEGRLWDRSMDNFRGSQIGVIVQCENGYVVIPDYRRATAYDKDGNEVQRWSGSDGLHFDNFLAAVKSRNPKDLTAEILEGHVSSGLCHTGSISHLLGQKGTASDALAVCGENDMLRDAVQRMCDHLRANEVDVDQPVITVGQWLQMDTATEQFVGNDAANALLRREYRAPFIVPETV